VEHLCKAKINHFDIALDIDHKVFWFDVTVYDIVLLELLKSADNLT
jgi:hypothetical protein